jgi:hypothetical protein
MVHGSLRVDDGQNAPWPVGRCQLDIRRWTRRAVLHSAAAPVVKERRQVDLTDATGGTIVGVVTRERA